MSFADFYLGPWAQARRLNLDASGNEIFCNLAAPICGLLEHPKHPMHPMHSYLYVAIAPLLIQQMLGVEVQAHPHDTHDEALLHKFGDYMRKYNKDYVKGTEEYHRRLGQVCSVCS